MLHHNCTILNGLALAQNPDKGGCAVYIQSACC